MFMQKAKPLRGSKEWGPGSSGVLVLKSPSFLLFPFSFFFFPFPSFLSLSPLLSTFSSSFFPFLPSFFFLSLPFIFSGGLVDFPAEILLPPCPPAVTPLPISFFQVSLFQKKIGEIPYCVPIPKYLGDLPPVPHPAGIRTTDLLVQSPET